MSPLPFLELARLMCAKRDEGHRPYVLFLGTGASLSSGCTAFSDIGRDIAGSDDPVVLFDLLEHRTHGERAALLGKHLRGSSPSSGYRYLAELTKAGYFDIILTTNVDSLLETSLLDAGLRHLRDYVCMINGKDRDGEIARLMKRPKPRIKIFKLHGDLDLGILAITPAETFQLSPQVSEILREHLNRDVLVVGYGPWDSNGVNRCLELSEQSIWYVARDRPDPSSFVYQALVARRATQNIISGEKGQFDRFFEALRAELLPQGSSISISIPGEEEVLHQTPHEPSPLLEPEREHLTRLHQILTNRFGEGGLRTLCFNLGIDYDDLLGEGKADKARELIIYLERRNRIPELVGIGKRLRPDVSWSETLND